MTLLHNLDNRKSTESVEISNCSFFQLLFFVYLKVISPSSLFAARRRAWVALFYSKDNRRPKASVVRQNFKRMHNPM